MKRAIIGMTCLGLYWGAVNVAQAEIHNYYTQPPGQVIGPEFGDNNAIRNHYNYAYVPSTGERTTPAPVATPDTVQQPWYGALWNYLLGKRPSIQQPAKGQKHGRLLCTDWIGYSVYEGVPDPAQAPNPRIDNGDAALQDIDPLAVAYVAGVLDTKGLTMTVATLAPDLTAACQKDPHANLLVMVEKLTSPITQANGVDTKPADKRASASKNPKSKRNGG